MTSPRSALVPVALALLFAGATASGAPVTAAKAPAPAKATSAKAAIAAAEPASAAPSVDRAELDRTQIIGNRELPKVLYIVPWKKPLPGDLSGRPPVSVLDEALAPVDKEVFRRQVQYDAQAQARSAPPAPAAK
jgi:hypothetical protein